MKYNPVNDLSLAALFLLCVAAGALCGVPDRAVGAYAGTMPGGSIALARGNAADKNIGGIHEVRLAIDSIADIPPLFKTRLKRQAFLILEKWGPLNAVKTRVVYTQTRRYLLSHVWQLKGGGAAGYRLLEKFFAVDFGNFVRLPAVTSQQQLDAHRIFKHTYNAVGLYINKAYKDTPVNVRKRLILAVGRRMESGYKSVGDYYDPLHLYASGDVPTVPAVLKALESNPFNGASARAFANAAAMLKIKTLTNKTRSEIVSQFVFGQSFMVYSTVDNILSGYFTPGGAAAARAYRTYPPTLVRAWRAMGREEQKRAVKAYRSTVDPTLGGRLLPTGAQVLDGSGVQK